MSKTMIKVTEHEKDKVLVKLNGVSVIPEFKELSGRRVPDDSKKPFVIEEHDKYKIGKFKVQVELTGTQKLNLFDEKESGDGKVTLYLSVFDKFQKEVGLKLENNDKLDILITDLNLSEKGYHSAVCLFIQKTDRFQRMPYQYSWSRKISEKDIGKSIISTFVKFQRPQIKNPDGTYSSSDSVPYFDVQTFNNGTEYANLKSLISLHYKTAKGIFGEEDERFKNKEGEYVTYFPSLMATNRVLKQLKGLEKYMDRSFIADMILEKNEKYYNGQLFSLSFTKKEKEEKESNEEDKTSTPDFPEIPKTEDELNTTSTDSDCESENSESSSNPMDFPDITNEAETEEDAEISENDEPMPDFSGLGM